MKFRVNVATNSDCVSLSLGLCSLFTFGVGSLLLHRLDEVIWNRRNLHNRAAESHEILSECSHQ